MPLRLRSRSVHCLSGHSLLSGKHKQNGALQTKGKLSDSARACAHSLTMADCAALRPGLLHILTSAGTAMTREPVSASESTGIEGEG